MDNFRRENEAKAVSERRFAYWLVRLAPKLCWRHALFRQQDERCSFEIVPSLNTASIDRKYGGAEITAGKVMAYKNEIERNPVKCSSGMIGLTYRNGIYQSFCLLTSS
jgi:hypothetical protein